MLLGDIALKARALSSTDTSSYSDALLLIDINIWYHKAVSMILESEDEEDFDDARNTTTFPIKTTAMVASQRDYSIPVSEKVLKIKRLDLTWNNGTNYYKAEPLDDGEVPYGLGSDTDTDANFIREAPRYDIKYNSIFIYPMPNATDVANGGKLRIEWERQITPFVVGDYTTVLTDSTVVPGFDDPFHPILAYGAAYEYAQSKHYPNVEEFKTALQDWEVRLRSHYGDKQHDRRISLTSDYVSYR